MKSKEFWRAVLQFLASIITAALTALDTTSCMGHGPF
ncbi:MAG: smalltalk protein [Prevotella sp.]|nr:smalltalk protein [Prevotella sp.]